MYRRIMHVFCGVALLGLAFAGQAQAVSLGKIEVASNLGESFYAEVPLTLNEGEVVSNVFVELASPADYRILEVYRDDALNQVRADVKKDSRGTRVELTSDSVIEAPFFNIVLKVRYERATHFKKYPVFLDIPGTSKPSSAQPAPTVKPVQEKKSAESVAAPAVAASGTESEQGGFKPYDGWARTDRYGPMVYGDTITTVAQRLRMDDRFTTQQVMVALFEKNSGKFEKNNINMIKAGTYLDVPTAEEVQRISPSQARQTLAEHEKRWQKMKEQPRYAAAAEAQRTRYSKRVRVGEEASGVAATPMGKESGETATAGQKKETPVETPSGSEAAPATSGGNGASSAAQAEQAAALTALKAENESLKKKLAESDPRASQAAKAAPTAEQAAAGARIKKLEVKLARMQAQLDRARQQASQTGGPLLNWVSYVLIGVIVLLMILMGVLMLRVKRPHPATQEAVEPAPATEEPEFEDVKEIEVEEVPSTDQNATVRMTADEFESAMGDSIPDLTDEDTSEMEPFQEEEEEPDPNVDYLSEADVYLRYGMEDEAEKQVQMALKLRADNKDAHIKLAEIRKARGDQPGLTEAMTAARAALAGEALSAYESAVASLGETTAGGDMEDTVPPVDETMIDRGASAGGKAGDSDFDLSFAEVSEGSDLGEAGQQEAATEEPDSGDDAGLDLGDLEWSAGDFGTGETSTKAEVDDKATPEASAEAGGELDFDFSAFEEEESKTPAAEEEVKSDEASADETAGDLDFDFSAFEEDKPQDTGGHEEKAETATEEKDEEPDFDISQFELPEPGAAEEKAGEAETDDDHPKPEEASDFDFDLGSLTGDDEDETTETGGTVSTESDSEAVAAPAEEEEDAFDFGSLDLSDEVTAERPEEKQPEPSGDADKTMAMDWSGDTSALQSGETDESVSSVTGGKDESEGFDFDLGEFDIDLTEDSDGDNELDEFGSTLQTNLEDLSGQFEDDAKKDAAADKDNLDDEGSALDLQLPDDSEGLEMGGFGLESVQESTDEEVAGDAKPDGESGAEDLDMDSINAAVDRFREQKIDDDMDFEATMRLDTLLGDFGKDDQDSSDDKKDDN